MVTLRSAVLFAFLASSAAAAESAAQFFVRAKALLARGDAAHASPLFERAAAMEPKNAAYHYWFARSMTAEAKKTANAVRLMGIGWSVGSELEAAVRLDPTNDDARLDLIRYYVITPRVLGGSASKAALQAAELAKRDAALGAFANGYIAYRAKDYELGRTKLKEAANAPSVRTRVLALTWLGYLSQETQKYDAAFDAFETILKIDPAATPALYELGRTSVFSGQRMERGEAALKAYLATTPKPDEPTLAEAHMRLAKLYERGGRKDEAAREVTIARKLDPEVR
jgi:tetratricopeptide (TPR) repeat protein